MTRPLTAQVPAHEMQRFLSGGWEPPLSQSERDWIMQRWAGKACGHAPASA